MNSKYAGKIAKLEIGNKHGSFGYYLKVGKNVGVKLIGRCRLWNATLRDTAFKSEREVKQSIVWKKAKREAKLLKMAEKSKLSPKFYEVGIYKVGKYFFPGIVMQHFNGRKSTWRDEVMDDLIDRLYEFGIRYRDHNPDNFLKTAKGWRVIDFSADYTKIIS